MHGTTKARQRKNRSDIEMHAKNLTRFTVDTSQNNDNNIRIQLHTRNTETSALWRLTSVQISIFKRRLMKIGKDL